MVKVTLGSQLEVLTKANVRFSASEAEDLKVVSKFSLQVSSWLDIKLTLLNAYACLPFEEDQAWIPWYLGSLFVPSFLTH